MQLVRRFTSPFSSTPYGPVRHGDVDSAHDQRGSHGQLMNHLEAQVELANRRISLLEQKMMLVENRANDAMDSALHAHSRIETLYNRMKYWATTWAAAWAAWGRNWAGQHDEGGVRGDGWESGELASTMLDA